MYWLWLSLTFLPVMLILGRLLFFDSWADFAAAFIYGIWGGLFSIFSHGLTDGGATMDRDNHGLLLRLLMLLLATAAIMLLAHNMYGTKFLAFYQSMGLPV